MRKSLIYIILTIKIVLLLFNLSILGPATVDCFNGSFIGFAFSLPILIISIPADLIISIILTFTAKNKGLKTISIVFLILSVICIVIAFLIYLKGVI